MNRLLTAVRRATAIAASLALLQASAVAFPCRMNSGHMAPKKGFSHVAEHSTTHCLARSRHNSAALCCHSTAPVTGSCCSSKGGHYAGLPASYPSDPDMLAAREVPASHYAGSGGKSRRCSSPSPPGLPPDPVLQALRI
jgi:hypothetical protein